MCQGVPAYACFVGKFATSLAHYGIFLWPGQVKLDSSDEDDNSHQYNVRGTFEQETTTTQIIYAPFKLRKQHTPRNLRSI